MNDVGITLLPPPRVLRRETGDLALKRGFGIESQGKPAALLPVAERLQHDVHNLLGLDPIVLSGPAASDDLCQVVLRYVETGKIPAQGYTIRISRSHIHVEAADTAGAFYAIMTLRQLIRQFKNRLPACRIEDHPAFPSRGIMLDISRNKVPTMETLFSLVDQMAEWKLNHLELYMEHTFAYTNHREVWQDASPMTAEEIRALDEYARERFVELVPNQNSFGHLHRWLKLSRYRDLAECPGAYTTSWGETRMGPFSLNPLEPRSLALLEELYAELLPNFSSLHFNVGCDETFDLGCGASREACERLGKGRVYLDFLLKIHGLVEKHGRRMLFWGDIVLNHGELIPDLPRDAIALVWGYEADHPFDEHCRRFAAAGIPFYVCPGTSTWNSIAGRTDNALANLAGAASSGLKHGATGYLITDWGDNGHWQPLPVSYLPYAAGASHAWSGGADRKDLLLALDQHVFCDERKEVAQTAHDLGNAYAKLNYRVPNASPLFRLLHDDDIAPLLEKMKREDFASVADDVRAAGSVMDRSKMLREDGPLIARELRWVARMLAAACDRARNPAARLPGDLVEEFKSLWLARNRPGGLAESVRPLERRQAPQ